MTGEQHRRSVPDRARRRAIRAHAARLGVPYSVAARLLSGADRRRPAVGPTIRRPATTSTGRGCSPCANSRSFDLRVRDTRLAADLPLGRAAHLAERFPPLRGRPPARSTTARPPGRARHAVRRRSRTSRRPRCRPRTNSPGSPNSARRRPSTSPAPRSTAPPGCSWTTDRWQLWARVEAALAAGEADARPAGPRRGDHPRPGVPLHDPAQLARRRPAHPRRAPRRRLRRPRARHVNPGYGRPSGTETLPAFVFAGNAQLKACISA